MATTGKTKGTSPAKGTDPADRPRSTGRRDHRPDLRRPQLCATCAPRNSPRQDVDRFGGQWLKQPAVHRRGTPATACRSAALARQGPFPNRRARARRGCTDRARRPSRHARYLRSQPRDRTRLGAATVLLIAFSALPGVGAKTKAIPTNGTDIRRVTTPAPGPTLDLPQRSTSTQTKEDQHV